MPYTAHQIRFFAEQLMLKRPQHSIDGLASAMSGIKVDLNPHQVDAALFALQSPLSNGVLLADEVGLGKTIEAGLVLAQCWSERKRKILLIVTASLRTQWRAELEEKFFIRSEILESKNYNKAKKENPSYNPFLVNDAVVICSYNFASAKMRDVLLLDWDLVIMDEAHKLRNVYKKNNVMGNNLKTALKGKKKLLLTATPLQNNLMELYGLVGIIDEQVFGAPDVFRLFALDKGFEMNERLGGARKAVIFTESKRTQKYLMTLLSQNGLDRFSRWLCNFFVIQGAERVEPLDQWRFEHAALPLTERISFLDSHPDLKSGVISIDKLTHKGIENEEHLIISVDTNDGTPIDDEMVGRMMELQATIAGECSAETEELIRRRREGIQKQKDDIAERNKKYFLEQVEKLDAFSEDLKEGLQKQLKVLKKEIAEKRKDFKTSKDVCSLDEMLEKQAAVTALEEKRRKMEREISLEEDRITTENEALQEDIRNRLNGEIETETIMTFSFEIV